MSNLCNVNGILNDMHKNNVKEENKVDKFLGPYWKLISDHEELQKLRAEKCKRQHEEVLNQVQAFQNDVSNIDKKTVDRLKVVSNNAFVIKRLLKETNHSDCIAVEHQFQKETISVVESLVAFTNNFPQMMEISLKAPTTGGTEILVPLQDTVGQFDIAIANGENAMETINQYRDHLQSTPQEAKENVNSNC